MNSSTFRFFRGFFILALLAHTSSLHWHPIAKNTNSHPTSKIRFFFLFSSRHDFATPLRASSPTPPPHVAPDARCHVVVRSAASSSPRGVHVSRWHTGTLRHHLSGIMGLLLLLYGVHCRASERPSSTTPSLATTGCDAVSIETFQTK